jgi:hypothetical protein
VEIKEKSESEVKDGGVINSHPQQPKKELSCYKEVIGESFSGGE